MAPERPNRCASHLGLFRALSYVWVVSGFISLSLLFDLFLGIRAIGYLIWFVFHLWFMFRLIWAKCQFPEFFLFSFKICLATVVYFRYTAFYLLLFCCIFLLFISIVYLSSFLSAHSQVFIFLRNGVLCGCESFCSSDVSMRLA